VRRSPFGFPGQNTCRTSARHRQAGIRRAAQGIGCYGRRSSAIPKGAVALRRSGALECRQLVRAKSPYARNEHRSRRDRHPLWQGRTGAAFSASHSIVQGTLVAVAGRLGDECERSQRQHGRLPAVVPTLRYRIYHALMRSGSTTYISARNSRRARACHTDNLAFHRNPASGAAAIAPLSRRLPLLY
jgi:hypothetical protein